MSKLTPQMIEDAKQMIVNLEVAKTVNRKTNTRRLPKKKILDIKMSINKKIVTFEDNISNLRMYEDDFIEKFAQYKVGQVYWIREPVKLLSHDELGTNIEYLSDGFRTFTMKIPEKFADKKWFKKCQGIPNGCLKEMARTFVKITNIRVERLQDMSYEDIKKEGCPFAGKGDAMGVEALGEKSNAFQWWINLWNSTAPKGYKWEDNPYVFVYEFERVENEKV